MTTIDWSAVPLAMMYHRLRALQASRPRMLPRLDHYSDTAECHVCESTFDLHGEYESADPDVGFMSAGWRIDIGLEQVSPPHCSPVLYACDGRRLLQEEEARRVAMAGGVAAVADCTALLSEDDAAAELQDWLDAERENAAVAAWEDR